MTTSYQPTTNPMPAPRTIRIQAVTVERVDALFDAGMSVADVADLFAVSPRTVANIAHRAGIALPRKRRRAILPAELSDPEWLTRALAQAGTTAWTIAEQLQIPGTTVRAALRAAGLPTGPQRPSRLDPRLSDPAWLHDRRNAGARFTDIAAELGCSASSVKAAAHRLGITGTSIQFPQLRDRAWLQTQLARGSSRKQIAAELGCSTGSVTHAMRRHQLTTPRVLSRTELADRSWLRHERSLGRSATDIARQLGVTYATVNAALRRHGLDLGRRPLEQRVRHDWNRTGQIATAARWNGITRRATQQLLMEISAFHRGDAEYHHTR